VKIPSITIFGRIYPADNSGNYIWNIPGGWVRKAKGGGYSANVHGIGTVNSTPEGCLNAIQKRAVRVLKALG